MPAVEGTRALALATIWEIPDELWERVEPVLAERYPVAATGRARVAERTIACSRSAARS
ncbi:MAG TPA: hypothetical protein VHX88_03120 [Solirubrobacteraceae bacterium]|nr:hypothetical protein [Solirubrobacteraceae bacterium]